MTQIEIERAIESIWTLFRETDRRLDQRFKETDQRIAETDQRLRPAFRGYGAGDRGPFGPDVGGREPVYQPMGPVARGPGKAGGTGKAGGSRAVPSPGDRGQPQFFSLP